MLEKMDSVIKKNKDILRKVVNVTVAFLIFRHSSQPFCYEISDKIIN